MYIYINGDIKEAGSARLSVFEHGFMYGLGLFETFRIYNGHPFLLDDHFFRLERGLSVMGIDWVYHRENVQQQLNELLAANKLKHAYVRYNVSAGEGELGLTTAPYKNSNTIIYMKPLPDPATSLEQAKNGKLLTVRRNSPESEERLKSHHYLNNILGKRETGADQSVEGLYLNEKGYLTEGVVSNLFWVKGTTIYTPAVETGILNGITRAFIINLAKKLSFYVREGQFKIKMLYDADEAFVTNSIQEIVRLNAVDDHYFTAGHSVVDKLQQEYKRYREQLWSISEMKRKED
ncbi:4-amino-4-deoxychorismate lyase [Alteribacillus persepolensis]|uniref:4-amino-4-deoxychorismate lyase n=1 Tax=Alteribacillus persepolensis TaxID=568899 RepID=A0A1G8I1R0_9BACI|nr:aminodeoxychorismate lyase [Alteribacillus persepolensis]SDI12777.1 4-amino-4-deoxychorismate lyase [Alteribacillus persepolensis]